jgi:hypothetical protein
MLALATFGDATEIGSFLFYVTLPKMAKASIVVAVLFVAFVDGIANKLCQCKLTLRLIYA